jgi:hypothetical protein
MTVLSTVPALTSFSDCAHWEMDRWVVAINHLKSEGENPADYFCGFFNDMMKDDVLVRKDCPQVDETRSHYSRITWVDLAQPIDEREIPLGHCCKLVDINNEIRRIRATLAKWNMPSEQKIVPSWGKLEFGVSAICRDHEGKKWVVHASGSRSRKY